MPPNLMPWPAKVTPGEGQLVIGQGFSVAVTGASDPRIAAAVKRLFPRLAKQTGIPIRENAEADSAKATLVIASDRSGAPVQKLGESEDYTLRITAAQARLTAPNALGALHGIETFLQLISSNRNEFAAPAIVIEDRPRFPW